MNETMGQIIRRLRKERNLTQEELAEQLNITYQAVSRWENGTGMPDISQVVPLARVFGVSTDVLFGIYDTDAVADKESILDELNAYSVLEYNLLRTASMEFETPEKMLLTLDETIIAKTRSEEIITIS